MARDCLSQFTPEEVQSARETLDSLEPSARDVQIGLMLNVQCDIRASVAAGSRSSDLGVLPSSGESVFSESDVDEAFGESDAGNHSDDVGSTDSSGRGAANAGARKYKTRTGSARRTGMFAGKRVCLWALQKLLGIGDSTMQTLRAGLATWRPGSRSEPQHPELKFSMLRAERASTKWVSVLWFFWHLYHSAAEGLPESVVQMDTLRLA